MTEITLRQQLAELQETHIRQIQLLEAEQEVCEARQVDLLAKIEELTEQAKDLEGTADSLKRQIAKQHEHHASQQLQAVLIALKSSYDSVVSAQDHWLTRIRLQHRRQEFLAQDPELESNLRDYYSFEQDRDQFLQAVPASYQQYLLKAHEERHRQLLSYLNLEERERNLQYEGEIFLQFAVMEDHDAEEVNWVLPFQNDVESDGLGANVLHLVKQEILAALTEFTKNPDWYFAELSTSDWAGFVALLALAQCKRPGQVADSTRDLLETRLSQSPLFQNVQMKIQVAEISMPAWELGQEVKTPLEIPEAQQPLLEASQGWYSEPDLVSWERPVRVAPDSLWNVQARRLRTMLIRMLAKGKVGHDAIPESLLWKPLPEPHRERLRVGIERLIDQGVLLRIEPNNGTDGGVTLNPGQLDEAQNLINRNVTSFWAPIIGAVEPGTGEVKL